MFICENLNVNMHSTFSLNEKVNDITLCLIFAYESNWKNLKVTWFVISLKGHGLSRVYSF